MIRYVSRCFTTPEQANFIWTIQQSINVVECPEFRDFILYISPDLEDSDLPHRDKMKALIMREFSHARSDILRELQVRFQNSNLWVFAHC